MKSYYQDEWVTIYHGDCREILPNLEKVNLVLTDPPYSSGARTDSQRQVRGGMLRSLEDGDWFSHDTMTTWGFSWFLRSVLTGIKTKITDGAHIYIFTDWRMTPNVYGMLEATGYRVNHCLVWAKTHFGMGSYWRNQHENVVFASNGQPAPMLNRGMGSVLTFTSVSPNKRNHATEKPTELIAAIIKAVPGELILDPFLGSGTTAYCAKKLNRHCIGIEIEEKYCEIAAKRCSQSAFDFSKGGEL